MIQRDVVITKLNTFNVKAVARRYVKINTKDDLRLIFLTDPKMLVSRPLVLGGGSNILLHSSVVESVVHINIKGKTVSCDEANWIVRAGAGEDWSSFVDWTIDNGYYGLENLSSIPGTVGASPVQNIGAYGVEAAEYISSVLVFDTSKGTFLEIINNACQFGYRHSIFKTTAGENYIIVEVEFKLPKLWSPQLKYNDLFNAHRKDDPRVRCAKGISSLIKEIRRAKLPDFNLLPNAGSFFKNPIISQPFFKEISIKYPDMVAYAQSDGTVKLAAGWLIEKSGMKGFRAPRAGVSETQALVLINYGGSGRDILKLAENIAKEVLRKFGVSLEIEPTII